MAKKTHKRDNTDSEVSDREWREYFESLRSTNGVYTPEQQVMRFATIALYVGMNVKLTTDEGTVKLPRLTGTAYNGETEIIMMGAGKDLKVAFKGDDRSHNYFEQNFVNPNGKFHPNNIKDIYVGN